MIALYFYVVLSTGIYFIYQILNSIKTQNGVFWRVLNSAGLLVSYIIMSLIILKKNDILLPFVIFWTAIFFYSILKKINLEL